MARTYTLSDLRTRVRERANVENNNFVSDAEVDRYIDSSYTALFDKLTKADPERFMREQELTGDGTTTDFAVASDYSGTLFLKYRENSQDYFHHVPRISALVATRIDTTSNNSSWPQGWHPVYNNSTPSTPMIRILPAINNGETATHVYTVAPVTLTNDSDTVDGISGWEEYVVVMAAIKIKNKQGTPPGGLERELAVLDNRLDSMIENRSLEPSIVVESRTAYPGPYSDFIDDVASWGRNRS